MQEYDHRINMEDIRLEMETLTDKQMLQITEAIKLIKWQKAEEHRLDNAYWFKAIVLPILQNFAEQTSSSFELEEDNQFVTAVSFRNSNDIEISGSSPFIKFALSLASSITITCDNDESILLLTYDCDKML